ncbi:MAG: hypothetical protein K6E55_10475 [Thermoguttaceae bacterium]|nr:hypothetical protein [Thermoguttaceae bacterium]
MNISRVLARFLSLMDVTLLLLGFFIILVAAANLSQENERAKEKQTSHLSGESGWNFIKGGREPVWLFAECEGPNRNKCFVLNSDLSLGDEVDQNSDADIRRLTAPIEAQGEIPLIILVSERGAFDHDWDNALETIEKKWGYPVMRARDIPQESVRKQ